MDNIYLQIELRMCDAVHVFFFIYLFFLFGLWDYWHCGHSWPIVPASGGRGKRSSRRKPALAPLLSITKSHMPRSGFEPRTAAVGSRRRTAWAMARPMLKWLVVGFPPRRPGFEPGSGHVGFVVDKVALEQVSSEYFRFPRQSSFNQFLHNHHHLSSGAGTIGQ
jgi:hypothetical protein